MFYRYNPCVPVDYSSVNAAFAVVRGCGVQQSRSIRVLLRPGRYILREAITVQAPSSVRVEIETMDMPDTYIPIDQASTKTAVEPQRKSRRSSKKLRDILACRTIEVENEEEDLGAAEFIDRSSSTSSSYRSGSDGSVTDLKRATLLLRTRRQNEPVIRVRQGRAFLKNLELRHISHGLGKCTNESLYDFLIALISLTIVPLDLSTKISGMGMRLYKFSHLRYTVNSP